MLSNKTVSILAVAIALCGAVWWFASKRHPQQPIDRTPAKTQAGSAKHQTAQTSRERSPLYPDNSPQLNPSGSSITPTPSTNLFPALKDAIPGEYLFKFYNENDRRAFEEYARTHGIKIIDSLAVGNVIRVSISDRSILDELLRNGPVAIDWMPNTYVRVPKGENGKPLTPPSGGYQPFGNRALEWLGIKDNADWGRGIKVAILDSGVNASGALSGRYIKHIDLIGESSHTAIHGTSVASIIAGDNSGVAPAVDLMSIKVMSDSGTGDAFTLAKGIIEAVDNGAQIINMSLGSSSDNFIVREAIAYAVERGVLLIAAAGNDAQSGLLYPARYADVIAVAGVDPQGEHLYFSNSGSEVDIAAPGIGVEIPILGSLALFSGTSAAAPFVAGTAAEVWARDNNLSPEEITQILINYSNDAGAPGDDDFYGAGVLDADRVNSRNKSGIYDMTAMKPFVENNESGNVTIHISAQNRGTEIIAEAILEVEFLGKIENFRFFNIHPGNTISQPFNFSQLPDSGLELRFSVRPVGVNDATPNNNAILAVISSK